MLGAGVLYYGQGAGGGAGALIAAGGRLEAAAPWYGAAAGPAADPGGLWAARERPGDDPALLTLRALGSLVRENGIAFELEPSASDDLERALALAPDWSWPRLIRGLARYLERDFAGALGDFAAILEREPDHAWARLLHADALHFNALFHASIAAFERLAAEHPRFAWAHALLGRARYLDGDPAMIADLDRAFELEPKSGWILAWRAAGHGILRDAAASERDYRRAIELQPEYERGRAWYGAFLVSRGRWAEGLAELRAAEALMPHYEVTHYAAARAHLELDDAAAARASMEKAIAINTQTMWVRGWSDTQQADGAIERNGRTLEAILERLPDWSAGRAWLGQTYLMLRRYREAIEVLDALESDDPRSAWLYAWRGEARRRLGREDAALRDFDAALERAELAYARAARGAVLAALGRLEEARADLDAVAAAAPRCGRGLVFAWRGDVLLRLGERAAARSDFATALGYFPNWRHWMESRLGEALPGSPADAAAERTDAEEYDARAWTAKAAQALRRRDFSAVEDAASRALEECLDPFNRDALRLRSTARRALSAEVEAMGRADLKTFEILLSYACNAKCGFCYNPPLTEEVLAQEVGFKRAADLLYAARRDGYEAVWFTGGEPTLRPDLVKLVALARKLGFRRIQVGTHGATLDHGALRGRLVAAGMNYVRVSLHAARAEVHDAILGLPGAFAGALRVVRALREADVYVGLNFVVNRRNLAELPGFFRLAVLDLGVRDFDVIFPHYQGMMELNDAELGVRYAQAAPLLREAWKVYAEAGSDLKTPTLINVPPCVVPELEPWISDWSTRGGGDALTRPASGEIDLKSMKAGQRMKGPACAACAFESECLGFERGYHARHGDADFRPVPAAEEVG